MTPDRDGLDEFLPTEPVTPDDDPARLDRGPEPE